MRPDVLAVIGLGAIGGSVAWQARVAGVPRVVGYVPDEADGGAAVAAGAVTELADSADGATRGADLVVLATPPHITLDLIGRLAAGLEPGTILTDVAGVKTPIVHRAVEAGLADRFAGGHPLAGTHGSGFAYARPDMLRGCTVYVCTTGAQGQAAADAVLQFWEHTMEASPTLIDAAVHDRQLAWTSHLPQAVAYALGNALSRLALAPESFGSGARDTTRLAASSPGLWLDIFRENHEAVLAALDGAGASLTELRSLIESGDEAGLLAYLARSADFRRALGA